MTLFIILTRYLQIHKNYLLLDSLMSKIQLHVPPIPQNMQHLNTNVQIIVLLMFFISIQFFRLYWIFFRVKYITLILFVAQWRPGSMFSVIFNRGLSVRSYWYLSLQHLAHRISWQMLIWGLSIIWFSVPFIEIQLLTFYNLLLT